MRIKNIFRKNKCTKGRVMQDRAPKYIEKDTKCDICENLGECQKDPFINARNAYRLYRKRYVDLLNLLSLNSTCDSGALEESISLCRTAEKNMFEKLDILFGEVKS